MKAVHLRVGMIVIFEGELWRVFQATHVTPGKGRASMQTKLKNLKDGRMKDQKFGSNDEVEKAHMETGRMQFLYQDTEGYHFMDQESYEQIVMSEETLGEATNFIMPDTVLDVLMHDGTPVGIELPATVDLKVVETTPEVKGATASAQRKPAKLETGLVVQVPAFISEGEMIRVRTADSQYMERA